MIGTSQTTYSPPIMFREAQKGTTRGDPMYEIWAQSNVKGNIPRPEAIPN